MVLTLVDKNDIKPFGKKAKVSLEFYKKLAKASPPPDQLY